MQRRRKTTKEERVCSICSQHFAKAEHLHRHFRSHTKEKPFTCPVCEKKFTRQDTLLRHSRSHRTHQQTTTEEASQSPQTQDGDSTARDLATEGNSPVETIHVSDSLPREIPHILQDHTADNMPLPAYDNMLLDDPATLSNTGLDIMSAEIIPMDFSEQQYGWLPQWNTETNLSTEWLAELTRDQPSTNWMASPMLGLIPDTSQCATGFDQPNPIQPPANPELTPISEPEPNPRCTNSVQKRWHTYSDAAPSGYDTPDLSKDRYQVDEVCHRTLADRLRQRVQDGPVPSTAFLNLAIQAYFANFHPIFPIIHAPSFRPHSKNGLLLLSVCSVGSLYLGSSRAVSYGISIYERLHKALLSSWESHLTTSRQSSANILALQASIIGQMFGFLMGRPKDLIQIDLFHGTCVAWSRQLKLSQLQDPELDVTQLEGQALEVAWREWAGNEERKRIVLALHLQDAEIACLLNHDPLMRHSIEELPQTASKKAFSAPDAKSWKTIMTSQASSSFAQEGRTAEDPAISLSFPHVSNDFELHVILRCIGSIASEQRNLLPSRTSAVSQYQDALISWHKRYRHSPAFQKQESSLMMLWHSIFMLLHMNVDVLESFCGREGPLVAEKHREAARLWATSDDARICSIHAMLVVRHFEQIPIGSEPPIHFPLCLYRCGIAWFCYTSFVNKATLRAGGELRLPELQAIGISGGMSLLQDAVFMDGRPDASPLFKIIHLLKRASHWKLGRSLASTLLSLAEDETTGF
ncbi:hypothetical protein NCS56_00785300 [Fusarium sp. Ph1]|nr:hypothetical protein NCS56_00785300 [Fusarium sp. Ph1]